MATMLTPSQFKNAQKQLARAEKDKTKVRRAALESIAVARATGHRGRYILAREDACGHYVNARWDLAQRRTQLRDVTILR